MSLIADRRVAPAAREDLGGDRRIGWEAAPPRAGVPGGGGGPPPKFTSRMIGTGAFALRRRVHRQLDLRARRRPSPIRPTTRFMIAAPSRAPRVRLGRPPRHLRRRSPECGRRSRSRRGAGSPAAAAAPGRARRGPACRRASTSGSGSVYGRDLALVVVRDVAGLQRAAAAGCRSRSDPRFVFGCVDGAAGAAPAARPVVPVRQRPASVRHAAAARNPCLVIAPPTFAAQLYIRSL